MARDNNSGANLGFEDDLWRGNGNRGKSAAGISVYGPESNRAWPLAKLNLAISAITV